MAPQADTLSTLTGTPVTASYPAAFSAHRAVRVSRQRYTRRRFRVPEPADPVGHHGGGGVVSGTRRDRRPLVDHPRSRRG
jgi:hypothetical protein